MANAASPQLPSSPARRWTFSLRTMLLVGVVIVLAVSHLTTTWRLKQATDENRKLRGELGYLDITDDSRIHAIQIPVVESMQWKWRVHLPRGGRFALSIATRDIPVRGYPGASRWIFDAPAEQMTLTVAIRKDHLGQWQVVASAPNGTTRLGMDHADAGWLGANDGFSSSGVGARQAESFDPKQPVELLRLRIHQKTRGGTVSTPDGPCPGILVWLQEQ